MNKVIRSMPGKVITFILAVITFTTTIAGLFGIAVLAEGQFYSTPVEVYESKLVDSQVYNEIGSLIDINYYAVMDNEEISIWSDKLEYLIIDGNGKTLIEPGDEVKNPEWKSETRIVTVAEFTVEGITDHFTAIDDAVHYLDEDLEYTRVKNLEVTVYYRNVADFGADAAFENFLIHFGNKVKYSIYPITIVSLIVLVACFITLMCVSARRPNTEDLVPGPFHIVPFDVVLLISAGIIALGSALAVMLTREFTIEIAAVGWFLFDLVAVSMVFGLAMSVAARIKTKTIISNNVIVKIIKFFINIIKKIHNFNMTIIRSLPVIWKTVIGLILLIFLNVIAIVAASGEWDNILIFGFFETLILSAGVLYFATCLSRLKKAGDKIAVGNTEEKISTKGLFLDLKTHAENLNKISDGIEIAVNEKMKSERMKTELITNVSHDIKTPLTSIINYADLITKEDTDNENIKEYSEVLVRQSEKLKRLIEDLVEASKASTGNLEVELIKLDASTFVNQADGEYEDKLSNANLQLITNIPDKQFNIMADSRRMWRVFDNLMNNICKYSQPGTRVYIGLEEEKENVVITFKNTSREILNITPDELMERFVRGDSSRNTEGNGLGLSIAKSLTELQHGTFNIEIDGDLFKVILKLPKA